MKNSILFSFIFICLCCSNFLRCTSNHTKVKRSFYYWKSTFELNQFELELLHQNNISALYIKYFDVSWNSTLNAVVPVAKIQFKQAVPDFLEVIPVVYITNNALLKSHKDSIKSLAVAISKLIYAYHPVVNKLPKEIQVDCDWTLQTKEKYFALLNELKQQAGNKLMLSATIRLHQVKYASATGIPPVQKGMLMYYNMGNIQRMQSNSIFNETAAADYAPYIKQYPLHLDAVLPVFSWIKVIRNQKIIQLLNTVSFQEAMQSGLFEHINEYTLKPIHICHFKGIAFLPTDILVAETMTPELSKKAARHLHTYFTNHNFTLALFHLNQSNLNEYTIQDIETIYTMFN